MTAFHLIYAAHLSEQPGPPLKDYKIFPSTVANCIDVERWKIDAKHKENIKKQLDVLGISRDKLFPELDETAGYLKEKFKEGITNGSTRTARSAAC